MAEDEPRAILGEPQDPESTLVGAQFSDATQGNPARAQPDKKPTEPKTDQEKKSDADTGDEDVGGPEGAAEHLTMTPKEEESETGKELVLFDFDGTLIEQDSLDLLMQELAGGWWPSRLKMIPAFFTAFSEAVMTKDDYMDYRSALKAHWMINVMAGMTVEAVQEASRRVARRLNWRDKLKAAVSRYADEGRDVVVASGAIDLCLKILLEGLPVTCVICTHAEVEDGKVTGHMAGTPKNSVNVVRGEKRYRVQKYIEERGPYKRVVGYGNLPSDGPMLSLCDEFFVI